MMTKNTDAEKLETASTIIRQMGGAGKLRAMVGAKDILALDSGVQFRFEGSQKANKAVIELTPMDTYNVKFYKVGRLNKKTFEIPVKLVDETEGAYDDMLIELFEKTTGLYLHF